MTYRLPTCRLAVLCQIVLCSLVWAGLAGCGGAPRPNDQALRTPDRDDPRLKPRDEFEAGREVPISAETHFAAGQFAESQGNHTLAMEQYRKALRLDPKHRDTLFRVGVLQVGQRNFNAAIETWKKYVEATNGDAGAYASLGFAYELAGRPAEAETAYLKGVQREPLNAPCRVNYGLMLARRERFNEAILQLQTVLSEAEVRYNLASVYESLGRKEQARIEYRKALELSPEMAEAQARLDAIE